MGQTPTSTATECGSPPFYDPIRLRPEFQAWLRDTEQAMAGWRQELAAMGSWTPEAVLGRYAADVERD